jgi:hypothetical protein
MLMLAVSTRGGTVTVACFRIGAVAVALVAGVTSSAVAQIDAFGGWDSEVGHQAFMGQRVPDAAAPVAPAAQGFGRYGVSPFGPTAPTWGGYTSSYGFGAIPTQSHGGDYGAAVNRGFLSTTKPGGGTVNAMNPLVHSIRHAAKRRGRKR